jgi:HAD superfamily hydrolase (TIGR01509 family)
VPYLFREWPGELERVEAYRRTLDYTPFLRQMAMEPDLLSFLAAVRPPLAPALSTSRTSTMGAVLDTFGLRPHFDLVVTALDVRHPKPHPEALLKILAHFGVRAEEGIFIGDSQVDVGHAAAVGMELVAFRNPELEAAYHVSSFREVLRLPPFATLRLRGQ